MGQYFPYLFIILFPVFGICSIVFGIYYRNKLKRLKKACVASCEGVVADVRQMVTSSYDSNVSRYDTGVTYEHTFSFWAGGRTVTRASNFRTARPRFQAGDRVNIRYNPDNPEEFYVEEYREAGGAMIFITVGVVIVWGGLMGALLFFL